MPRSTIISPWCCYGRVTRPRPKPNCKTRFRKSPPRTSATARKPSCPSWGRGVDASVVKPLELKIQKWGNSLGVRIPSSVETGGFPGGAAGSPFGAGFLGRGLFRRQTLPDIGAEASIVRPATPRWRSDDHKAYRVRDYLDRPTRTLR